MPSKKVRSKQKKHDAELVWMDQPDKGVEAHLIALNEKATTLFEKARADGATNLLEPVTWLANEDAMRKAYNKMSSIDNPMARAIMCNENNPMYVYMDFMCRSYPRGFGKAIVDAYEKNAPFDGCETFRRLGGTLDR